MSAPRDNGERSPRFSDYHLSPAPSVRSTCKSARSDGAAKRWACMVEKVVANFPPMKLARGWGLGFCAFAILVSAFGQTLQPEAIRPTGVPTPVGKVDAATPSKQNVAKAKKDDTATPKIKRPRSKTKRAASTPHEESEADYWVREWGCHSLPVVAMRLIPHIYRRAAFPLRATPIPANRPLFASTRLLDRECPVPVRSPGVVLCHSQVRCRRSFLGSAHRAVQNT